MMSCIYICLCLLQLYVVYALEMIYDMMLNVSEYVKQFWQTYTSRFTIARKGFSRFYWLLAYKKHSVIHEKISLKHWEEEQDFKYKKQTSTVQRERQRAIYTVHSFCFTIWDTSSAAHGYILYYNPATVYRAQRDFDRIKLLRPMLNLGSWWCNIKRPCESVFFCKLRPRIWCCLPIRALAPET